MPELNAARWAWACAAGGGASSSEQWLEEARRGTAFRGDKSEHRHDQTVAGVLAARLGMTPLRPRGLEPLHRRPAQGVAARARLDRRSRATSGGTSSRPPTGSSVCGASAPLVRF